MAPHRLNLLDLPDDVISLVISEISSKHYQASLCLTCKKFNEIATPKLYKDVTVNIGTWDDSAITQLLSPQNKGLQYIRQVVLKVKQSDCPYQTSQIQFVVGSLLQALPRDCLEYFRWRPWKPLSSKNVNLLYKTQTKMTELELLPLPESLEEAPPTPPPEIVKAAKEINLFVGSPPALEQAHHFVKNAADELDILMIQCYFQGDASESAGADDPLHDTTDHNGRTLRTIFKHKLGLERKEPIKTRTLHLQEVAIHQAPTWFRVIDARFLTKLILLKCDGAAKALGELCRLGTASLRLEELDITHCEQTAGGDVRGTIETILNVVSGLKTLEVELCCCSSLIQPSSVCRQATTLKRLELFCTEKHASEGRYEGCLHYSPTDIGILAQNLERLEELMIPYPKCEITDSLEEETLGEMFEAMTGPKTVLSNLRTMQFYTWPARGEACKELPAHLYDHILSAHASIFFDTKSDHCEEVKRLDRLWFIAWGARIAEDPEKHTTLFVKGTRAPMLGLNHLSAVPVTLDWFDNNYDANTLGTMDIAR